MDHNNNNIEASCSSAVVDPSSLSDVEINAQPIIDDGELPPMPPFTVLIEGNIGSGKSTFLEHFEKFEEICAIPEPVEKWMDYGGVNLLEGLYTDPKKWAVPFQSYVLTTMLDSHYRTTSKPVKMMERSLYSGRYCFIPQLHKQGSISAESMDVFDQWFKFIDENMEVRADLIIYLKASPTVAHQRILKRARSEEECVSLEYLENLDKLHDAWLMHDRPGRKIPVLVLNADKTSDEMMVEYKHFETYLNQRIGPLNRRMSPVDVSGMYT